MKNNEIKNEQSERKEISVIAIAAVLAAIVALTITVFAFCNAEVISVNITNNDVKIDENGEKYVVVYLDESGKASYQLEWEITPESSKARGVEFEYNKTTPGVTVNEKGLVSFTGVTAVEVTVCEKNSENSSAKDKILLIAKYKNQ